MRPPINTEQVIQYELDISDESEWISVTPCEMAREAFFYVQEAGHFYCGPRYFTRREGLKSYLIKCILGGRGSLEYRGRRYELLPGSFFFVKCDELQYYKTEGESWEHIWFHFNGATSHEYFTNFYEARDSCVVTLPRHDEIAEIIEKILNLYRIGGVYADIMASQLILEVLTRLMIAAAGVDDSASRLPRPVQDAVDIIKSDYAQPVTLDYLARRVSLNKQYLQKLFKKHTGVTPNSFLASTRVNRAKELLRFSDMLIEEVAAAVGVENTSHFIKTFKSVTEMTPNTYRRMWSSK